MTWAEGPRFRFFSLFRINFSPRPQDSHTEVLGGLHYLAKPGALNPKSGGGGAGGGGRHSLDRRVEELPPLRNLLNPQNPTSPRTLEGLPRGSIVVPFWDYLIGFYI